MTFSSWWGQLPEKFWRDISPLETCTIPDTCSISYCWVKILTHIHIRFTLWSVCSCVWFDRVPYLPAQLLLLTPSTPKLPAFCCDHLLIIHFLTSPALWNLSVIHICWLTPLSWCSLYSLNVKWWVSIPFQLQIKKPFVAINGPVSFDKVLLFD